MRKAGNLVRLILIAVVLATVGNAAAAEPLIDFETGTSLVGRNNRP